MNPSLNEAQMFIVIQQPNPASDLKELEQVARQKAASGELPVHLLRQTETNQIGKDEANAKMMRLAIRMAFKNLLDAIRWRREQINEPGETLKPDELIAFDRAQDMLDEFERRH